MRYAAQTIGQCNIINLKNVYYDQHKFGQQKESYPVNGSSYSIGC
jgi:hypothetical protein